MQVLSHGCFPATLLGEMQRLWEKAVVYIAWPITFPLSTYVHLPVSEERSEE